MVREIMLWIKFALTLISGNITRVCDKSKYLISLSVTVPSPRGTLSAYIEMSSLCLSKQTKEETTRQAPRRKSFKSLILPIESLHCRSLQMAEMSFCIQPLRSNSVFQFTMTEATEGFFWLSAVYLPCMSCQNAASLFYIFIFGFLVKVNASRWKMNP